MEKLLKPVNRLAESCVLNIENKQLFTICTSVDNSVILLAKTEIPMEVDKIKLNIINIKKFMTGLDCLGEDGDFKLLYNENNIICKSVNEASGENTHFKYHLVDDNIIKESTVSQQSIAKLSCDTLFELSLGKIKQIMSAYSFSTDVNKIYFYTKDNSVYADIDDKTLQNIDNVSIQVANEFKGEPINTPISLKIEVFKNLATSKNPIKVKINNEFKVFIFQTQEDENTELKYIISALVK